MENEVFAQEQMHELSCETFSNLVNFKEIYDIGKMFASSKLVPQAYQGQAMDCTIAVDMANRMGVSPMMVMQNLYVVKGKPSWSGQACIAMINASGKFKSIRHKYIGEEGTDSRGCYVEAVRSEDGEKVCGTKITIAMAKAEGWLSNPKWKNMPDQMLAYRASAFFARVYIPNALMGMQLADEVIDINLEKQEAPNPFKPTDEDLKEIEEIFG